MEEAAGIEKKKEITLEIKHPEVLILLAFLLLVFYLELQVTLNSPIAFGDEGFHTTMARWIGTQKEYPVWEPTYGTPTDRAGYNHKPLWNILEGSFYLLFGFNDAIVKVLTPFIASILLGLAVFVLVKKIYNKKIGLIASMIAITLPTIATYAVLMYTDALFTFYFTLFVLTFVLAFKTEKMKYWILTGILAALALLTKNPGYAIFPFLVVAFLYTVYTKRSFFKSLKKFLILIIVMVLITSGFYLRSYAHYGSPDCYLDFLTDVSGCNIHSPYEHQYEFEGKTVEAGTEQTIWRIGIISYFEFAYGYIWFVGMGILCGLLFMFLRKTKVDILLLLTFFALMPIFYLGARGRSEDLARYTLGWAPIISLVAARYFVEAYNFIKKYQKYLALSVFIFIIVATLVGFDALGVKGYGISNKLFGYEKGGSTYAGLKDIKQFSPAFLEMCDWIKNNLEEDVRIGGTIWAGAAIYNCQRNFVGSGPDIVLSNNLDLALSVLKMQGVTHLYIQKFSISWGNEKLRERTPISFVRILENNTAHFEKIRENGPSLDDCQNMGGCDGTLLYKVTY